jgi:predicted ATPase
MGDTAAVPTHNGDHATLRVSFHEKATNTTIATTALTNDEMSEPFAVGDGGLRRSTGGRVGSASGSTLSSGMLGDDESWEFSLPSANSLSASVAGAAAGGRGEGGTATTLTGSLRQSKTGQAPGQKVRKPSKSKRLSGLTVNKLQFNKLGHLYGREKECRLLKGAWEDVRSNHSLSSGKHVIAGGGGGSQEELGSGNTAEKGSVHKVPVKNNNEQGQSLAKAGADKPRDVEEDGSENEESDGILRLASPYLQGAQQAGGGITGTGGLGGAGAFGHESFREGHASFRGEVAATATHSTVRRLVTVRGESGTGKSALIESIRGQVFRGGGFFIQGKFPQQLRLSRQSVEPYAAFIYACNELCELVVSIDAPTEPSVPSAGWYEDRASINYSKYFKFTLHEFRERLTRDLASEARVLTRVIPGLRQVLKADDLAVESGDDMIGYLEGHHQLKFAFRRFLRTVATFGPVVLAIDDLQWADVASMELLEALVTDRENSSLMVIGCYRDDAVYGNMPHVKGLENIQSIAEQDATLKFDSIPIGNLAVEQVNELLVDLLSSNASDTLGLAECVHRKTLGNIFFVIQFLTMLQDSDLLLFNFGMMKWVYNLEEVQLSTAATQNVVMLMKNKMQKLPESIGFHLPIMACLGSSFSLPLFSLLVKHVVVTKAAEDLVANVPEEPQSSMASRLIARCIEEGLIEPAGKEGDVQLYQWVHDKIQEAAFTLVNESELQNLKLHLGKILFEEFKSVELERNLFTVANLLSAESDDPMSLPRQQPVEVSKLFLRAGVKTIENSAFEQAAGYLKRGIDLLPQDHWQRHYDLSLDLFSTAAEANYCTGSFDTMRQYCNAVTQQKDRPLVDMRRVYCVLIESTGNTIGHPEALQLCKDLLSKLGVNFPKRAITLHVLAGLFYVKSTLKKATSHELTAKLPMMSDQTKQWRMWLLDKFVHYTYLLKSSYLPLGIFKGLTLTMSDGVNLYAPVTFALVSLILPSVNDFTGAHAFADQANELLKHIKGSRKVESRVLFLTHTFAYPWLRPIPLSVKPLLTGYEVGMATGDTESAAWSIFISLEYSFRSGMPLETLVADCSFYCDQLRDVKQLRIMAVIRVLWQSALHLSGENSFDGTLTGDIVQQEKELREAGDYEAYLCTSMLRMLMYVQFVLGTHHLVHQSILKTDMHKGGYEKGT